MSEIKKLSTVFAGVLVCSAVMPLNGETWYLNTSQNSGTRKAWDQPDSGQYWTNSKGETGSGALIATDTYYLKGGKRLRGTQFFAGGNLWIGDPEAANYEVNVMLLYGNISCTNGSLNLVAGYASKSTSSTSTYNLNAPIVWSPKDKPFGFMSGYANMKIGIKISFTGEDGVGFVIGGYYDGSGIAYMSATNVTCSLYEGADLSKYHGEIRVVSNRPLISPTKGNVTFTVPPTDSDATLQIESGAEFGIASVGEVKLSSLTLHTESLLTIPYDSTSKTTGVIRVTDQFSIPEDEGKVGIHFATKPSVPENEWPYIYPILIVPSTQEMDAEKFALSNESVYVGDEKPLLRVFEDKENGVKSLVAIFPVEGS